MPLGQRDRVNSLRWTTVGRNRKAWNKLKGNVFVQRDGTDGMSPNKTDVMFENWRSVTGHFEKMVNGSKFNLSQYHSQMISLFTLIYLLFCSK